MVKGDQDSLKLSSLYLDNADIFNYYLQCIIEFSQQFDPTETLMIIANDPERREFIHAAPEDLVPLSFITTDLWPKLGFLPIDPENPGVALIAEFMLNELVLKNSDSLDKLNLQHLKELFSGEGDEEENEDEMDEEMRAAMEVMEREQEEEEEEEEDGDRDQLEEQEPREERSESEKSRKLQRVDNKQEEKSEKYSEASSDDDDLRAMDIGALRRQREEAEAKAEGKPKSESNDDAYEEDFS